MVMEVNGNVSFENFGTLFCGASRSEKGKSSGYFFLQVPGTLNPLMKRVDRMPGIRTGLRSVCIYDL